MIDAKGAKEAKGTKAGVLAAPGSPDAGAGVRVAVIDSGVHAAHPHVQGVAGGVAIDDEGGRHDDFVDRLGHGTAVTAVIREKAPAAEVWCVKVFDRELAATGAALAAALAWARAQAVHVINLSLGTTNLAHRAVLNDEVARARAAGIVIVAAGPVPGQPWLPGGLPGVVRVHAEMTMSREQCAWRQENGELTVAASGYPRPIPGVPPERNLKGVSFAVANTTAILAATWPHWPAAFLPLPDTAPSATQG